MGEVITIVLGFIFIFLSLLHFAWAAGLKWGFDASLPTNEQGEKVLNPKPRDSIIVGIGLGLFAIFYLSNFMEVQLTPNKTIDKVISWVIPLIFVLRSIGDFKYFGFFKKVKATAFGKLDSTLIIPLCLLLAVLGFLRLSLY